MNQIEPFKIEEDNKKDFQTSQRLFAMDESRTIDKYKNLFQDVKKVQSLQTGYESIFLGIKDGTKIYPKVKKL